MFTNKHEMDMTTGNLFRKIIVFCVPLMLTGILQMFYHTADLIIVGRFSNQANAVGAVGSTSALINLIVNLFMGLSVGTNVMVARYFSSQKHDNLEKCVHTSITVSLVSGTILGIIGFFFAKFFLSLMQNPIDLAVTYLRIYFIGMPFNMLFNFAASVLRGIGDTKRPLIFLMIAGLINVFLNMFFVIVLGMSVDGVAYATIISQFASCIMIIVCLLKTKEAYGFRFNKMQINGHELIQIAKIGLPAGVQGSIFSISNVIIQSTVNQFGASVIDGNSIAQSIEGFVYISMNSVYNAALSFIGQNVGAQKYENIKRITWRCLFVVTMIGVGMGGALFLAKPLVTRLYTTDPNVIEVAFIRLHYLCLPYFLCGIMDVMVGCLRGLGTSFVPMVVSILGVCGFRITWIYTIFYRFGNFTDYNSLHLLYVSYPISWVVTFTVHVICFEVIYHKLLNRHQAMELELEE